jgi:hypothetical protein
MSSSSSGVISAAHATRGAAARAAEAAAGGGVLGTIILYCSKMMLVASYNVRALQSYIITYSTHIYCNNGKQTAF